MDTYFEEQNFKGIDYTKKGIVKGGYNNCTFLDCDFSNLHASNISFVACKFINSNFSNAIIGNSSFKGVKFNWIINCF